ncbi:hypothetical protein [Sutcliffiella horikoshii]|uniref:hypothetical protein n=1 Tax=Sutcliffiella horikoshii TaxID=79883 RepID=UPI00384D778C
MEFILIFSVHFIIMGSFVMLFSIIMSFVAKKLPVVVTILSSMLIGVLYANIYMISEIAWFSAVFSGLVSALAIALVKVGMYAGKKAEKFDG